MPLGDGGLSGAGTKYLPFPNPSHPPLCLSNGKKGTEDPVNARPVWAVNGSRDKGGSRVSVINRPSPNAPSACPRLFFYRVWRLMGRLAVLRFFQHSSLGWCGLGGGGNLPRTRCDVVTRRATLAKRGVICRLSHPSHPMSRRMSLVRRTIRMREKKKILQKALRICPF